MRAGRLRAPCGISPPALPLYAASGWLSGGGGGASEAGRGGVPACFGAATFAPVAGEPDGRGERSLSFDAGASARDAWAARMLLDEFAPPDGGGGGGGCDCGGAGEGSLS
jgi:hypothetical protein